MDTAFNTLSPEAIRTYHEFDDRLSMAESTQRMLLANLQRTGNYMILATGSSLVLSWLLNKQGLAGPIVALLVAYCALMGLLFWRWWQYMGPAIDAIANIIEPFREYVYPVAMKQGWNDTPEFCQFQFRVGKFLIADEPERRNKYSVWQRFESYWYWSWQLLIIG